MVRNQTQVDQELLEHCPTLEMVGRLGVGLDNIDTGACEQRGIDVVPATGTNAIAVAEYVIAAIPESSSGLHLGRRRASWPGSGRVSTWWDVRSRAKNSA